MDGDGHLLSREMNNCLSIYHTDKLKKIAPKATLSVTIIKLKNARFLDFRAPLDAGRWKITSESTNQRASKALSTCAVYTKKLHSDTLWNNYY